MADVAVEQPVAETTAASMDTSAETPVKKGAKVKTTKTATPKAKATAKVKKAPSDLHPKYSQMISEAITMLKDRHGTSRQAILKYIKANYNVLQDDKVVNNHIKMSLRAGVKSGKLKQCKGSGACGSYKLGDSVAKKAAKSNPEAKSPKASLTKVKKPKDVAAKKAKASPKKATAGKTDKTAKKAKSPAKKAAKSPKKSPAKKAAKSPKKAAAKKSPVKKTPAKKAAKSPKKEAPKADEPAAPAAAPAETA